MISATDYPDIELNLGLFGGVGAKFSYDPKADIGTFSLEDGSEWVMRLKNFSSLTNSKTEPSEDDKRRLRSLISWIDNHIVKDSRDKVTVALLWTVWELAKSWGME